MALRKRILKEVLVFYHLHPGPGDFVVADTLKCFTSCPLKKRACFAVKMQQLIVEELLICQPGPTVETGQSRIGVKVNPEKIDQITRELQIDWKWIIGTIIALLGVLLAYFALK